MQAETIDQVIAALDEIIAMARSEGDRSGYFATLYRHVTQAVKDGITAGVFDDGERLARLDVTFANRYLEARQRFLQGKPTTAAWGVAFEAARSRRPIVLQHLLLGMNAHINLDLAIATVETSPGSELKNLRSDFLKINQVLALQIDGVKASLSAIWPKLRVLDWLAGSKDDRIINFSLTKAREQSWQLAEELNAEGPEHRRQRIELADRRVAKLARLILKPGPVGRFKTWIVRSGERGTVPDIIDLLAGAAAM